MASKISGEERNQFYKKTLSNELSNQTIMKKNLFFFVTFIFTLNAVYAQINYKVTENEVIIFSPKANLIINKEQWLISLQNEKGKILFEEAESPSFLLDSTWFHLSKIDKIIKLDDQTIKLTQFNKNVIATVQLINNNAFRIKIELSGLNPTAIRLVNKLKDREEVYGFGEMWNGKVSQRGNIIELWDKNGTPDKCAFIPYYVTTENYTYFLDFGGLVNVDVGKTYPDKIVLEAPAASISILLTTGNSISEAVKNYLKVTGIPSLPPRWAFKPWFWLFSPESQPKGDINLMTQEDILTAARKFKDMDIPAGVTWVEPPWQTARNSFEPSSRFSGDFKAFVDQLHNMGLKVLCWTTPYTLPNSSNWKGAIEKHYLVRKPYGELPETKISSSGEIIAGGYYYIDFTNPAARKWWQTQIKKVLRFGIDGFKLDAGQDLPMDAVLYKGKLGKDLHNAYGLYYNQTFYEILNKTRRGDFLTIPRSAWSGSNEYTMFKWPGDLSTSFAENGLPANVYSSISLGFSGFPSVSTDIGGFEGRPAPEEVWIRWAQFGAMLPGMQTLYMPWWYSKKASDYYRYLSWLHTELVPYFYSLANEAHFTGAPICRHLVWSFQEDPKVWRIDDEFTIGNSILVAPVISQENTRKVYIPKGNWFDFWTDKKMIGQQDFVWSGDLYQFPMYVKEGAIIPLEVKNQVTGFGTAESSGYTTIAVWPKEEGKSSFTLYDTELPVYFEVNNLKNQLLQVKWSGSKKNYIIRIHLDGKVIPKQIINKTGDESANLIAFSSMEEFYKSDKNGWVYDTIHHKIWIKKKSQETQCVLNIRLSKD